MALLNRALAALALGVLLPLCAAPVQAAAADTVPAVKPLFVVKGFRSATFGMTANKLLAAIKADFGFSPDKVQIQFNPTERTTYYTITVDTLAPGPGPAKITYTLGASAQTLSVISVVWVAEGEPTVEKRAEVLNDGIVLSKYFRAENWAPNFAKVGVPISPNALAMFLGKDAAGAGIEVEARGVTYDRLENGKTVGPPPAKGPAALVLIYHADVAHPDVFHLAPGSF